MSHFYQTWFTWLSGNWCLYVWVAWSRDSHQYITLIAVNFELHMDVYCYGYHKSHTHTQTLVSNLVGIIIITMLLLLFLLVGNILLWHIVGQKICNLYCILTFKKKLKKKRDDLYLKHLVHNSRHSMSSYGYASYTRQLMQTSWLRCHATHNQDKVLSLYLPNDLRNQYVIKYYQPFFPCVARMNKETL